MNPVDERPGAILALWNDIAAARIPEYDRWHTLEHVPERVWVPGFISGTRFVATGDTEVRYFTLYEMETLASLESTPYRDLVDNPTPWSASMRPSFSNFLRKTCEIEASSGVSLGAGIGILRQVLPAPIPGTTLQAIAVQLLNDGASACVSHVRIARVMQAGPQAIRNVQDSPDGHEYLVLAQTADLDALSSLKALLAGAFARLTPAPGHYSQYRFASRVLHRDVRQPQRPAPRLGLMSGKA